METTMISNEAYAKIVNLIKTFYLQGFEDAANCPEPLDIFEDIKKQLDIVGIKNDDDFWHDYNSEQDNDGPPSLNSLEYVLVSTSYDANETYIFPANANGEVTHWGEIGGIAERWDDEDWASNELAMERVFGYDAKDFKIVKTMWGKGPQYLYQRTKGDA